MLSGAVCGGGQEEKATTTKKQESKKARDNKNIAKQRIKGTD